MKELMKRPNERGREDFENAISDDLETQNFQNFHARCQPWWHLMGVGPSKWPLEWPSCRIYINIRCKHSSLKVQSIYSIM
jgi:hypothetical protein